MKTILQMYYSLVILGIIVLLPIETKASSTLNFKSFKIKDISKLSKRYQAHKNFVNKLKLKSNEKVNLLKENNLYARIYDSLQNHYRSIGQRRSSEIVREGFQIGRYNTPGFFWKKSFGDFGIFVRRNIAKGLGQEQRWVITDEFNIIISAEKIIGNLAEDDILDISKEQMALFGGLKFKRVYRFTHFADSYEDALVGDYSKLFMSFLFFNSNSIFNMSHNEHIQKEDYLTADVGGVINYPVYVNGALNLYGGVGAIAEYEKISKTSIFYQESDERVFLASFENTKSRDIGLTLQLRIDFLNLLKITLFSYDFNYQNVEGKRVYLKFVNEQIDELQGDKVKFKEIMRAIKGDEVPDSLLEYQYVEKRDKSVSKNSRYLLFLHEGRKTELTKKIDVLEGDRAKSFYTHTYEKVKNRYGIISRIIPEIIQSLFLINVNGKAKSSERKLLFMEYQSVHNLVKDNGSLKVDTSIDKLTITIERDIYHNSLKKDKNRLKIIDIIKNETSIDEEVINFIERREVIAPIKVNVVHRFNQKALQHFNALSVNELKKIFENICENYSNKETTMKNCVSKIQKKHKKYLNEFIALNSNSKNFNYCKKKAKRRWFFRKRKLKKCLAKRFKNINRGNSNLPMTELKDLVMYINRYYVKKEDLNSLFGKENSFTHGSVIGSSNNHFPFVHYFQDGEQKSGVINSYFNSLGIKSW